MALLIRRGRDGSADRWLNATVLGVGLASLFADASHEMATAALPAFLASLGASSAELGLIEGLSDGLSSLAKLFSGYWTDGLKRRKPLAVLGYAVTALAMASLSLARSWFQVLAARMTGWIGRGARGPVRNTLLTEATAPESYGRAFGLERAMDSLGAFLGPLLALFAMRAWGLRPTFALSLIPGLLASLVFASLVLEKPREPREALPGLWLSARSLPAAYKRFLAGVGLAGAGDFSNTLLILWATQAWTPRLGTARAAALAMLFYAGYNAVYALSCYAAGVLADRCPKKAVLASGYALGAVPAALLLAPGAGYAKFILVFGLSGLYMGFWETVEGAAAAEILPPEKQGLGFGSLAAVNGAGDFVSSAVVGGLWALSPTAAMSFVIATSLAGAALIAGS